MSQFYDLASLVVIPSGYKASTIYAQKPLTTDGQLSFSRASGATRVASNGLIEKVRTNYALQSQSFATASAWATTNGTLTNNAGTAPDGTNTASKLVATDTDPFAYQSITLTGPVVASCYFKGVGSSIGKTTELRIGAAVTSFTLTANWQRVSVTSTVAGAVNYGVEAPNLSVVIGDEVLLWGFQVEYGDVATDYIPTTTAAVSVGPVSNVPRLDYLGSSCPRLLLEPQRTNLVFFSEQLNNAGWAGSAVVTANTAVSPDGSTNADSVMESATTDFQIIGDPVTTVSGTAYTYSFFAKPNGRNFARVLFGNGSFPDDQSAYFNLLTGATSATASVTASMVSYGNGWWRCIATCTSDASATDAVYFGPARNMTDGYTTYAGNASLGIYAYGAQQEAGAYATSYIPTLAASVTRVADAASKTGISSLIGQTEGVLFVDVVINGQQNTSCNILNSEKNVVDSFYIQRTSSGTINAGIFANSVLYNVNAGSVAIGQRTKIALAYKSGSMALYINGVLIGTRTESWTFSSSLDDIFLNDVTTYFAYQENVSFNQALLFKTRLTNAQLAELTAL